LATIHEQCQLLAQFPRMGRSRTGLPASVLAFPVGKYIIYYRVRDSGIEVARVLHSARNQAEAFEE
jgi:toxin ParE1/3/4